MAHGDQHTLTEAYAQIALTRNGEQSLVPLTIPDLISWRKHVSSTKVPKKGCSTAKNADTSSDTTPSPATTVHGLATTFRLLRRSASASSRRNSEASAPR